MNIFNKIFTVALFPLLALSLISNSEAKTSKPRNNAKQNQSKTFTLSPARITNGSSVGFAYSLPNNVDGGINLDNLLAPASTMKVLTAAAALIQLKPDFQFSTDVLSDKSSYDKALQTKNLKSDLIIKFSGAPDLSSYQLFNLIKRSTIDQGINEIKGNIILDTSYAAGYDRANGWVWDDLPLCFSAPASAIVIDHNCIHTSTILKKGGKTFTHEDKQNFAPFKLVMDTPILDPADYTVSNCSLTVEPSISNEYRVKGCFTNKININKNYQLDFKFAVQNPNLWGMDIVKEISNKLGLKVKGKVLVQNRINYTKNPDMVIVSSVKSAPLYNLLEHTLKKSDNLYAEEIGRAAAANYFHHPVTIKEASNGVVAILHHKANIDFRGSSLHDCSGLSSYNIISARVFLDILKFIKNNESTLKMVEILPQSGVSGTMRFRKSVVNYPLQFNVIAKTGTIHNVKNLAGFVKSEKGNLIPFVIFTNGLSPDKSELKYISENKTLWPNFEFEKRVLQYLYMEQKPVISK